MNDTLLIVPTYNNAGTLEEVLVRCQRQGLPLLVVDDGSTDGTPEILSLLGVKTLTHPVNRGKGRALKTAFQYALTEGYSYAITLDSDGQHFPEDIPALLAQKGENTLVVGSRSQKGADGGGSFANRFSNFWFTAYTGIRLTDTQTGFRLYPLRDLPSMKVVGNRYEAELSLLLFSAWKGLRLVPVQVRVNYPRDRVTHFRPFQDFMRITLVNIIGLPLALLYGWPRILLHKLRK